MKLIYSGFDIGALGEFTLSQSREYEEGQRAKVTLKVGLTIFERSYADNYTKVLQLKEALRTMEATLQWTNDDTNQDYLNQAVTLVSNDLPDEWGQYSQQVNLVFFYYEQSLTTNNLPLTFAPTGGASVTLGNVSKLNESRSIERFSPFHSQRSLVKGEVTLSGYLMSDATLPLADRRTALAQAQSSLMNALTSQEGVLQFGPSGSVFNRTVKPEKPSVEIDQLHYAVTWSFTASYTVFPDEATFATVEYQADQRDPETGEQYLTLTGKITAKTEAIAQAKLASLTPTVLAQYGYAGDVQQLRNDVTPHSVSANQDGDTFIELNFTLEYKRWRPDNTDATFAGVSLGHVDGWDLHYNARRFNELHSQRSHAGGQVSAKGTWSGSQATLLAQQAAMYAAVNVKDGTLVRSGIFSKTVRVEDFVAKINQAITGIEWSFTAIWSEFPQESGFATVDYTVNQTSNAEDGEERMSFSGTILAPDQASATSTLTALRITTLSTYGFNINQQLVPQSTARTVSADADGVAFIELTFNEEYRRRRANLVTWVMSTSSKADPGTGLVLTNYSGHVVASGAGVDAAYQAALAKAQALADQAAVLSTLGGNAYQKSSQINWDQRQIQAGNVIEFVRLTFDYQYQSKLPAGQAYLEVNTDSSIETFGSDSTNVSGSVVAVDFATAMSIYLAQVRTAYNGRLIRNERTTQNKVMPQSGSGFTTQELRMEFSFSAFSPKASGTVNYRYGVTVSNDFLTLTRSTRVQGSVFSASEAASATAAATLLTALGDSGSLGKPLRNEHAVDHEYSSASSLDAVIKYDFSAEYQTRITDQTGLLEMRVSESVKFSGVRWIIQPIPRNASGTGGVSIPQDGGQVEGSRTVRGTVTGTSAAVCQDWARQQRAFLTGDTDGRHCPQPEEMETDYEFVPRMDGVATGGGQNVRLWRVNFGFSEVLPNYLPPS